MPDHYFEDVLPKYEAQCAALAFVLIVTSFFWIILFPYVVIKLFFEPEQPAVEETKPKVEPPTTSKQRKGKGKKNGEKKAAVKKPAVEEPVPEPPSVPVVVPALASFACMVTVFLELMLLSPYNTFVPRGVFQAPLLTPLECEELINISMAVAHRNQQAALKEKELFEISGEKMNKTMEGLLLEPEGWQKYRHQNYPTTDLNIITDPFSKVSRSQLPVHLVGQWNKLNMHAP